MTVIGSSSPLVAFAKIDRWDILERLFGEILIPPAVRRDVLLGGPLRPGRGLLLAAAWVVERPVMDTALAASLPRKVGPTEAETITLALEMGGTFPLLMDGRNGRRLAERVGLRVLGSGGALLLAKERGIIQRVRPLLDGLRAAGLFLSREVYDLLLRQAGE